MLIVPSLYVAVVAEVLLTVVTSLAAVVAAEAVVLIEATVEEASLSLCTLDPPATASSCKLQASS